MCALTAPKPATTHPRPPVTRPRLGVALVHVLEEDPDLAAGLDPVARRAATQAAVAPLVIRDPGPWRPVTALEQGSRGNLILDGIVGLRLAAGARAHLELLGPGDVISPWLGLGVDEALSTTTSACVHRPLRLALLDRAFALRTGQWPEISAAIAQRLIVRSRHQALQGAINASPRIEQRIELTLRRLAYRFGTVTPNGIRLPIRLTHSQLAEIVAARRPSVTLGLKRLVAVGRLDRTAGGMWLVPHRCR